MAITYSGVPTKSKWLSDSSVSFAVRSKDPVLARIDALVETCNDEPLMQFSALPDLFWSVDYWLKTAPNNKVMEKDRTPAMTALYKVVVEACCRLSNCTVNTLPRELELTFGREMTKHGVEVDLIQNRAKYMNTALAQTYKLRFRNGRAYQMNWFEMTGPTGPSPKLVLANSSHGATTITRDGRPQLKGFSGFVMSIGRSFYMAKHVVGSEGTERGVFHSSYLGDRAVSAAGTILIEEGVVKAIRPDSGHFQPGDINMLAALQALIMVGVPTVDMEVYTLDASAFVMADRFMRDHTTREAFRASRERALANNTAAFDRRPRPAASNAPAPPDVRHRPAPPVPGPGARHRPAPPVPGANVRQRPAPAVPAGDGGRRGPPPLPPGFHPAHARRHLA